MNKLFLALIALSALMLVVGCLTTGKIDWDIKGDKSIPTEVSFYAK